MLSTWYRRLLISWREYFFGPLFAFIKIKEVKLGTIFEFLKDVPAV